MAFRYLFVLLIAANTAQANDIDLANAARAQIGITKLYDAKYSKLKYPNGDVSISSGVCTDVVIRALRTAHKMDLQQLVHEDMSKYFSLYPKNWGLKNTDKNIDHRRVPNLQVFFKRHWQNIPISDDPTSHKAGDIVTVMLPKNLPHIMLVSNIKDSTNHIPLIIHNIGNGTQEENRLFLYQITGHYRLPNNH